MSRGRCSSRTVASADSSLPSAKVIVDDKFSALGREYERGVQRALGRAASVTVAAARAGGQGDYNLGSIVGKTKATPVHRARKGWRIFVYVDDFRAIFFEKGTYSKRRAKLSPQYRRTAKAQHIAEESGTGVKAQRMLGKAVPVARAALQREVQRELG